MIDLQPFWITLRLALTTTLVLVIIGLPLANLLATTRSRWRHMASAVISLPLVLPPTVLGFYFLVFLGPAHGLGRLLDQYLNLRLVFSFPGLVVASVLYSLPFMVQPLQAGIASLPASLREAAATLGKSPWATFRRVILPNIRPSLITAIVLTFAHTVGEFGVVLMIGGNIPGQTRVVSIAIYDEVEAMNFHGANIYAGFLLLVAFLLLVGVSIVNRRLAGRQSLISYDRN